MPKSDELVATRKVERSDTPPPPGQTLLDYLERRPGVNINTRATPSMVTVRGDIPLFVVDGLAVGKSYASAAHAINVLNICSVELLQGWSQTIIYGKEAVDGVIVIKTFENPKENKD